VSEFVDGSRLSTNNAAYNFPMRRDPTGAFIRITTSGLTGAEAVAVYYASGFLESWPRSLARALGRP
jgi:hypothetical protein